MFPKYHKIDSIFKRDKQGKFTKEYSCLEFEALKDTMWNFTEKIDGTNIRIYWDGESLKFGGRTDNAQIPAKLFEKLQDIFTIEKMQKCFPDFSKEKPIILYGEGYGCGIQKAGEFYLKNDVNFILFDVRINNIWLVMRDIFEIAKELEIPIVPYLGWGTLNEAIEIVKNSFKSEIGDIQAEGIVLKHDMGLLTRLGRRIITKVKTIDFN